MENNNDHKVLDFPLKKMIRQKSLQRHQERKAIFGLSIMSLMIFTLAINQWVSDFNQTRGGQRAIASIKAELAQDIMHEHLLASKLADSDSQVQGLKSIGPSLKDELVFSTLEGKYEVQTQDQRIKALASQNEQVILGKAEVFVAKYITLFNENAVHFKLKNKSENEEVYELLDGKGLVVDTLSMSLDSMGKLTKAHIL